MLALSNISSEPPQTFELDSTTSNHIDNMREKPSNVVNTGINHIFDISLISRYIVQVILSNRNFIFILLHMGPFLILTSRQQPTLTQHFSAKLLEIVEPELF